MESNTFTGSGERLLEAIILPAIGSYDSGDSTILEDSVSNQKCHMTTLEGPN